MAKNKGRLKNKTRTKRGFNKASYIPNTNASADNESTNSSINAPANIGSDAIHHTNSNLGAYIDHRMHNDLAHIHSSPARSRRRSSQAPAISNHQKRYSPPKSANDITNGNGMETNRNLGRRESLPLTNQNLQSLISQSNNTNDNNQTRNTRPQSRLRTNLGRASYSSVALDMDQFTQEQQRMASQQVWHNPYNDHDDNNSDDGLSISSLKFGGSNPSSDHSSDSTSLDDVCFPDYYDHNIGREGSKENNTNWPDLEILQEFIQQESEDFTETYEDESIDNDEPQNVNFNYPIAHSLGSKSENFPSTSLNKNQHSRSNSNQEAKEHPSASTSNHGSREDTPLLGNTQVNELDHFYDVNEAFRIRPTPIQPWEKSKENIPTILHNQQRQERERRQSNYQANKLDSSLCRFTYFREDLEKTIHSPTISGLLANGSNNKTKEGTTPLSKKWGRTNNDKKSDNDDNNDKEYEDLTLPDLFMPAYYSAKLNASPSSSSIRVPTNDANISKKNTNGNLSADEQNETSTPYNNLNPATNNNNNNNNTLSLLSGENRAHSLSTSNLNPTGLNNQKLINQLLKNNLTFDNTITAPATTAGSTVNGEGEPNTNPFWLDVLNPTEEEMKVLSKTFGIHPLTTEDIFLGEAREKVELFKSYYFICFTSFDIVYERRKQRAKEQEKKLSKLQEMYNKSDDGNSIFMNNEKKSKMWSFFSNLVKTKNSDNQTYSKSNLSSHHHTTKSSHSSYKSKSKKIREGELSPLNMYMIVFKDAVITFHFSATPHPINVRRRARLLRDYLNVSSDWICYALVDDITDSFAPMIESIEEEVNLIEDAILKMHSGDTDSEDESDNSDNEDSEDEEIMALSNKNQNYRQNQNQNGTNQDIFYKRKRSKSTIDTNFDNKKKSFGITSSNSSKSKSKKSSSSKSTSSKILGWKRKGDMLRRIGECRKRVMSVLRLLGSKADVIKGFSKRFSEQIDSTNGIYNREKHYNHNNNLSGTSSKSDIGMYLGDIQDHIVTMTQSLNHYEKLLARFHSNYLAQINIDMTKVNNDTNDVLGKITILGTIVLPINVVTGLWGMNCIVPGQDYEGLAWFWSIVAGMFLFSIFAYHYAKLFTGL